MKRYAYFDNAKLILIFLVVFGHMIQPFISDAKWIHTLYTWMYTYHMPAFIFLAGFFAKGSGNLQYISKLAKKLIIPYIVFQLIYTSYYFVIGKADWFTDSVFYPHWSLWFLFSLFCWHIMLILYKKLPAVAGIAIAVTIGILVGFSDNVGHTFSLSRTFVFFPYFLFGYWMTKDHVMLLKQKSVKVFSLVFLAAVAITIYYLPDINSGWLLASKSYSTLGMESYGGFARLLVYLTSTLMAASILAWIPQKQMSITVLGTRTLYVYLLHGFFIQFFRQYDFFHVTNIFHLLGLAILSAAIVLLLSNKVMLTLSQPLIEGNTKNLRSWFHQRKDMKDQNMSA
ncbi:MAG TPA: acyltransferase family protein [Pseudogracilibacillus sp.]|nr:acyltransferase family protein [Pseudogracilibacillus sp.]